MFCFYSVFFFFLFTGLNAAACDKGWFGLKCQYLCHCSSGTCDESGQCSSKCAPGWFGLKCQYQDLATIPDVTFTTTPNNIPTALLTDQDDNTCITDPALESIKISWPTAYPLSWTRFKVKYADLRLKFNINFITASGQTLECNPVITNLDATTVDYRCPVSETAQHVVISGTGVKSLCSVSISGGRNVALKQTATQSSTLDNYGAHLAVDGNTNNQFLSGTCTHTTYTTLVENVNWALALDSPKAVQRIVLYNRGDCCDYRLKKFKLETLNAANDILWTYQDTNEALPVYTVVVQKNDVNKVRISPTYRKPEESCMVVALCEVEIYGECTPGMWGLDCKQSCSRACSTSCHQDTGNCPTIYGYLDPSIECI